MRLLWDNGVIIENCPTWFKGWVAKNYPTYINGVRYSETITDKPTVVNMSHVVLNLYSEYGFVVDSVARSSSFPKIDWITYKKRRLAYTDSVEIFNYFLAKNRIKGKYMTMLRRNGYSFKQVMEEIEKDFYIFTPAGVLDLGTFWEKCHVKWVCLLNDLKRDGVI